MKFTFDWLREHLETDRSITDIVEKLSMIGLEVEGLEDRAEALGSFRVAHVISAKKHPDADRLKVCQVEFGDGDPVQVVCGGDDTVTPPAGCENIAASFPNAQFEILPGLGHASYVEGPDAFNAVLADHLSAKE